MQRFRRAIGRKELAMFDIPAFVTTTAFCFWLQNNPKCLSNSSLREASAFPIPDKNSGPISKDVRSFQTAADKFFHEHKHIPIPKVAHAKLQYLSSVESERRDDPVSQKKRNILVIGDVHGCYDELMELHAKAIRENNSLDFSDVILVGDLCNKGPESAKVIRHVRVTPGWFSVRGNHDDGALAAALGDEKRLRKKTYQWVRNGVEEKTGKETNELEETCTLSDEDIEWMSQLPYTIEIPGNILGDEEDTIIVHAGLVPNQNLEDQSITTMTTIRDLILRCDNFGKWSHFDYHTATDGREARELDATTREQYDTMPCNEAVTWASAWKGPQRVIFGHDAKRKLQQHEWATGLDTGAVYGGKLTGIILPDRKLVSVQSKEYSPIVPKINKTAQ